MNHSSEGHFIREIARKDDDLTVYVDELRRSYAGLVEGGNPGYFIEIANLVFELEKVNDSYRISKYYHKQSNSPSKYDGLFI